MKMVKQMVTMITGTVATSSPSTVRELKQNEVSREFKFQQEVADDLLRFDFPKDYTMKLGCQFDTPYVRLYKDNDTLIFSVLEQPLGDHILLSPNLWNPTKSPTTTSLSEYEDHQFFCVPRSYAEEFNVGDDITYTYVNETEDRERYITCSTTKT